MNNIVAYLLKARAMEPEEQRTALKQHSFLGSGRETAEQRPWLGNVFLISSNRRPLKGNVSANTFSDNEYAYENERCWLRCRAEAL
jgi:hypothetical protein